MENNYQLSRIHNYIHGLMSREEMHALEREALEDPFLQDAIDGYKMQRGVDVKSLSLLQQRLERRIAAHSQRKNRFYFSWQRLAIGTVAAVMFIAVCTLILIRHFPNRQHSNLTEVELMDDALLQTVVYALPAGDARPIDGWEAFSAFVSTHYSGANTEKRLEVRFKVGQDGLPYDVRPQVAKNHPIYQEIIQVLQKGPKWEGKEGAIEIVFPE
ncbi:anti-sigma factor [Sphingobacterium haloxyli]|uniref:TonB C-terminal domain-containing protein n=1 Tax=Sphingobacterium haloxyli TaxID=2100533 RepID=A0A2S9J0Q0_9SPHI|nr:hypothetical protein [Sphingobacterium haloxyli]PRD46365.1 hypothetical protein C5745_15415 [Sphingobacterium haloxyli]